MFNTEKALNKLRTLTGQPTKEIVDGEIKIRLELTEGKDLDVSTVRSLERSVEENGDDIAITKILRTNEETTTITATMWLAEEKDDEGNFLWGLHWGVTPGTGIPGSVGASLSTAEEAVKIFNRVDGPGATVLM